MTEKKEFQVNKNTPFWDASLTDQERIDWLLKEMTVEEKLGYRSEEHTSELQSH